MDAAKGGKQQFRFSGGTRQNQQPRTVEIDIPAGKH